MAVVPKPHADKYWLLRDIASMLAESIDNKLSVCIWKHMLLVVVFVGQPKESSLLPCWRLPAAGTRYRGLHVLPHSSNHTLLAILPEKSE